MPDQAPQVVHEDLSFRRRKWSIPFFVSWLLFPVSMFLPSYYDGEGWRCALQVFAFLGELSEWNNWEYYYYGLFNLDNAGMIVSPLLVRFVPADTRKGKWVMLVMSVFTLHVISWTVLTEAVGANSSNIKIGYYLWAASFIIFTGEWIRQTFLRRIAHG